MAEPKMVGQVKVKKKRGVHLSVKDEHIILAHNSFVTDVLGPINSQLRKQGLVKTQNNALATKVLADAIIPHIKNFDIELTPKMIKKKKKIRFVL